MSIEAELKKWAASPAGKKKIAEARKQAIKSGKPFGGYIPLSRTDVEAIADRLRNTIYEYMPDSLSDGENAVEFYTPDIMQRDDGSWEVEIDFNENTLSRPSLEPNRYPDGAYNIVSLFIHGWDTHGKAVFGEWHGDKTWSRSKRAADPFVTRAVSAFNAWARQEYPNEVIIATASGEYENT